MVATKQIQRDPEAFRSNGRRSTTLASRGGIKGENAGTKSPGEKAVVRAPSSTRHDEGGEVGDSWYSGMMSTFSVSREMMIVTISCQ